MTFASRNLSVLAYGQGFTLWHYRALEHGIDDVLDPDFFDDAGDMVVQGDMLLISARDGGRVMFANPAAGRLRVTPLV